MRLRNIAGSREYIAENNYVIHDPEEFRNNWDKCFGNNHPIHIEIGMGKGKFIHELALRNPNINYLGIEKYSSVLYRAIKRHAADPLDHLLFLRIDAENLPLIFGIGEIDRIYLNFSDPWPKDRHAKRRLTSPYFLNRYNQILGANGQVIFKTDNRDLFDYSLESAAQTSPWQLRDITYDLYKSRYIDGNIPSEYEEKFVQKNIPIHRFVAFR
ncbi:MAG: tRNA (guanosine(46)-N7)-methyltransferase TrmB [Lachnoclostridium sp.]|jgi:tRNA (guanine-N7-)-methyltransferase|nr:tRNA (guanosine(46)-N7)-methyltransferase TrmB [Lachnoclostridium sp.]